MQPLLSAQGERATLQLHEMSTPNASKSKGQAYTRQVHTKPSHLASPQPILVASTMYKMEAPPSFLKHTNQTPGHIDTPAHTASHPLPKEEYSHKYHAGPAGDAPSPFSFVGATLPIVNRVDCAGDGKGCSKGGARKATPRNAATSGNVAHFRLTDQPRTPATVAILHMTKPSILNAPTTVHRPTRKGRGDDANQFNSIVQGGRPPSRAIPSQSTSIPLSPTGHKTPTRTTRGLEPSNQDDTAFSATMQRKSSMSDIEIVDLGDFSSKVVFRTKQGDSGGGWRGDIEVAAFQADFGSWADMDDSRVEY
ncbi:hypothetical protein H257_00885 [Aphanomyces astaci]|uniref:Uncharacterized protein n=1 Tax=Aphanomyces astaci TaxID=112090 RepID=W4HCQ8_APHAT|nr:hypothetical protein H257_00885 [Aphanomyces astaci]ETV89702.1 hypothetical protein H257_00885 [Aphanomyces astaci]KAF0753844.1 hypothetical protein AaE_005558 [Aphanomyces astaci]|eukprot:XP_009822102.1 hypothetical protein H257_00885 [Aphanomyces astaci]